MKISLIFLLSITLHGVFSGRPAATKPPAVKVTRPSSFATRVNDLILDMATANGYSAKFDRCHVVPWKFMATMIENLANGKLPQSKMRSFINDLARIHKSATYYQRLSKATKKTLTDLTNVYKADALAAVKSVRTSALKTALYNMPSNLYPGDRSNNRSIQNNLDPPKAASSSGKRSKEAVQWAKNFLANYAQYGLTALDDPSAPGVKVKSSDIPPGDTSGDYVKII